MRYTTIIDIREYPALYRNTTTRLVYLHLTLIAGWHDSDRDTARASYYAIAADAGVTVSAARWACKSLEQAGLISRLDDGRWRVKKYMTADEDPVTTRPKWERLKRAASAAAEILSGRKEEREQREREHKETERRQWNELLTELTTHKTNLMRQVEQWEAAPDGDKPFGEDMYQHFKATYPKHVESLRRRDEDARAALRGDQQAAARLGWRLRVYQYAHKEHIFNL